MQQRKRYKDCWKGNDLTPIIGKLQKWGKSDSDFDEDKTGKHTPTMQKRSKIGFNISKEEAYGGRDGSNRNFYYDIKDKP